MLLRSKEVIVIVEKGAFDGICMRGYAWLLLSETSARYLQRVVPARRDACRLASIPKLCNHIPSQSARTANIIAIWRTIGKCGVRWPQKKSAAVLCVSPGPACPEV